MSAGSVARTACTAELILSDGERMGKRPVVWCLILLLTAGPLAHVSGSGI